MIKSWKDLKDPGSAITHFIAVLMVLAGAVPLMLIGTASGENGRLAAYAVFCISILLLYTASTLHHSLDINEKVNRILRKFDHMMIYVLIAGTYTPICMINLGREAGIRLCVVIWCIAAAGMITNAFWITCPKWFSSLLYIMMGWACVFEIPELYRCLPVTAFCLLFTGGFIYTVGGVLYAMKLKPFNDRHEYFGSHEIFHLFCIGGSACHFVMMFFL